MLDPKIINPQSFSREEVLQTIESLKSSDNNIWNQMLDVYALRDDVGFYKISGKINKVLSSMPFLKNVANIGELLSEIQLLILKEYLNCK